MSASRRYEILLPLRFNDGQLVPEEVLSEALLELEQRFGAVSWETQVIHGAWQQAGRFYRDDLIRLFVDVPDLPEHRQFFLGLKQRLKVRYRQMDIWLTSHDIDIL